MGAENFKKQDALLEKATKQKNLTDEEVDWLIDFSRRGTVIANNEFASSRVRVRSLLILRSAELTPAQKEKVYQLCIPILANSVSDFSNADKASAINTLGKINDKRAIPYILPFADDKNKYTRRLANETLSKLK